AESGHNFDPRQAVATKRPQWRSRHWRQDNSGCCEKRTPWVTGHKSHQSGTASSCAVSGYPCCGCDPIKLLVTINVSDSLEFVHQSAFANLSIILALFASAFLENLNFGVYVCERVCVLLIIHDTSPLTRILRLGASVPTRRPTPRNVAYSAWKKTSDRRKRFRRQCLLQQYESLKRNPQRNVIQLRVAAQARRHPSPHLPSSTRASEHRRISGAGRGIGDELADSQSVRDPL